MATVRILSEETRGAHLARTGDAIGLAGRLPRLAIEARRIATGALHGIHGRRRAGVGRATRPAGAAGRTRRVS